ncbi:hypothetical protein GCM10028793_40070 [Nocardiopsis oceani]
MTLSNSGIALPLRRALAVRLRGGCRREAAQGHGSENRGIEGAVRGLSRGSRAYRAGLSEKGETSLSPPARFRAPTTAREAGGERGIGAGHPVRHRVVNGLTLIEVFLRARPLPDPCLDSSGVATTAKSADLLADRNRQRSVVWLLPL